MAEGQKDCREAFEKWADDNRHCSLRKSLVDSSRYDDVMAQNHWELWQAACDWMDTRAESGLVKEQAKKEAMDNNDSDIWD